MFHKRFVRCQRLRFRISAHINIYSLATISPFVNTIDTVTFYHTGRKRLRNQNVLSRVTMIIWNRLRPLNEWLFKPARGFNSRPK